MTVFHISKVFPVKITTKKSDWMVRLLGQCVCKTKLLNLILYIKNLFFGGFKNKKKPWSYIYYEEKFLITQAKNK